MDGHRDDRGPALSESDRRALTEIERRLRAEDPMLAVLARRVEPALSQRPRAQPVRRCRAGTAAAVVAAVAVVGWVVSPPLALLATGLAGGALALRVWE